MTYLYCLYILGDPSVWYGRNNLYVITLFNLFDKDPN